MRVLHWYPNFLGGGGVANAVLGLANAQQMAGATVAIAAAESHGRTLYGSLVEQLGDKVALIRWNPLWTLNRGGIVLRGLPRAARRILVSWQPDIVHIHGEFNPDNLRVPLLFSCPLVLSPHGAFHPEVLRKSNALLKRLYINVASPVLYRKVIFHRLSPAMGDPIPQFRTRVKVYIAPNGPSVPVDRYLPDAGETSRNPDEPVQFLFVGRLDTYTKGLDLLLAAFAEAISKSSHPGYQLTLVGPDWKGGRALLEQQVKSLSLEQYVRFEGTKVGEDLVEQYKRCDVYIHCSRHEGQSIAITEALLFGKPAILSSRIATVSYPRIRESRSLIIVEPHVEQIATAIGRVAQQIEVFHREAREELPVLRSLFSWHNIAAIHLTEYANAIAERKKRKAKGIETPN